MELSAKDLLTLMEIVSEYGSEKVISFIVTLLVEVEKLQDEIDRMKRKEENGQDAVGRR